MRYILWWCLWKPQEGYRYFAGDNWFDHVAQWFILPPDDFFQFSCPHPVTLEVRERAVGFRSLPPANVAD